MKLSTNTYQRFLWIAASACLLGIAGCSNLPGTASSRASSAWASADTAKYTTNGVLNDETYRRSLDSVSVTGLRPKVYDPYADAPPAPFGSAPAVPGGGGAGVDGAHSAPAAPSSSTSSSTASSGTSSGGHSGGK